MTRLILLTLTLLLPLPTSALWVCNNDLEARPVSVVYSGATIEAILAPGESQFFSGVPLEVRSGTARALSLRLGDEWCVWGKDKLNLQRRPRSGTRRHG